LDRETPRLDFERLFQAWDYARIDGTMSVPQTEISHLRLVDPARRPFAGGTARFIPSQDGAAETRFTINCLAGDSTNLGDCLLELELAGDPVPRYVPLARHVSSAPSMESPLQLQFRGLIAQHPAPRVLEIGGRDRSGVSYRGLLGPVNEYVGLDILPGPGVDVVADAHEMSSVLGEERFDFACSYDVWEHLAMPWKAVIELNRVLVTGGYALILAPQACGMHDLPWDFYRFSDSGFRALFAPETGFELVGVARDQPMHLFPFVSRRGWTQDELTAGFFAVTALVRKIGRTALEWPADASRVLDAPYPA
jgi:SAM-dependent methyltransferase